MSLPVSMQSVRISIHRPFGSPLPLQSGVPARLVPALASGRGGVGGLPRWTHTLDLNPGVDLRDGCTRPAGSGSLQYADGDEVRIQGSEARYVVVWVEEQNPGTPLAFRRAYLLRHQAGWGPISTEEA